MRTARGPRGAFLLVAPLIAHISGELCGTAHGVGVVRAAPAFEAGVGVGVVTASLGVGAPLHFLQLQRPLISAQPGGVGPEQPRRELDVNAEHNINEREQSRLSPNTNVCSSSSSSGIELHDLILRLQLDEGDGPAASSSPIKHQDRQDILRGGSPLVHVLDETNDSSQRAPKISRCVRAAFRRCWFFGKKAERTIASPPATGEEVDPLHFCVDRERAELEGSCVPPTPATQTTSASPSSLAAHSTATNEDTDDDEEEEAEEMFGCAVCHPDAPMPSFHAPGGEFERRHPDAGGVEFAAGGRVRGNRGRGHRRLCSGPTTAASVDQPTVPAVSRDAVGVDGKSPAEQLKEPEVQLATAEKEEMRNAVGGSRAASKQAGTVNVSAFATPVKMNPSSGSTLNGGAAGSRPDLFRRSSSARGSGATAGAARGQRIFAARYCSSCGARLQHFGGNNVLRVGTSTSRKKQKGGAFDEGTRGDVLLYTAPPILGDIRAGLPWRPVFWIEKAGEAGPDPGLLLEEGEAEDTQMEMNAVQTVVRVSIEYGRSGTTSSADDVAASATCAREKTMAEPDNQHAQSQRQTTDNIATVSTEDGFVVGTWVSQRDEQAAEALRRGLQLQEHASHSSEGGDDELNKGMNTPETTFHVDYSRPWGKGSQGHFIVRRVLGAHFARPIRPHPALLEMSTGGALRSWNAENLKRFGAELFAIMGGPRGPSTTTTEAGEPEGAEAKAEVTSSKLKLPYYLTWEIPGAFGTVVYRKNPAYLRNFVMRNDGGRGVYLETHSYEHIYVPQTEKALVRVLLGRRVVAVDGHDSTTQEEKTKKGKGHEKGKRKSRERDGGEKEPLWEFVDVHVPFGFGLLVGKHVVHGNTMSKGPVLLAFTGGDPSLDQVTVVGRADDERDMLAGQLDRGIEHIGPGGQKYFAYDVYQGE